MGAGLLAVMLATSACSTDPDPLPPPGPSEQARAMDALAARILGEDMTSADATKLIEASGWTARVKSVNGEPRALTRDYVPERFNLDIVGPTGSELVSGITFG